MTRILTLLLFPFLAMAVSLSAQQSPTGVIRVQTRLVEVYASVYDKDGHHVDGISRDRFEVLEDGKPQQIANFETNVEKLSCAVLLDTTGSMAAVLPRVKNAVSRLIDSLGAEDEIAIYTFDRQVMLRQEFTTDKASAKRALLRLRAEGETALFDSIAQTTQEVAAQPGKKAIVIFTDGDDNASTLNSSAAVNRAKKMGIPLYTVAEGEALQTSKLKNLLKELSETTGAASYEVRKPGDVEEVFQEISHELQHLYLLSYKPPSGPGAGKWRKIDIAIKGMPDFKIRAKQGYATE